VRLSTTTSPTPAAASMIAIAMGNGPSERCNGPLRKDPNDLGFFVGCGRPVGTGLAWDVAGALAGCDRVGDVAGWNGATASAAGVVGWFVDGVPALVGVADGELRVA
jgi:hypothetical protein